MVDVDQALISHQHLPVVVEPGESTLHDPSVAIAGHIGLGTSSRPLPSSVWDAGLDASAPQAQGVTVVPFDGHQLLGSAAGSAPLARHPDCGQGGLRQLDLCLLGTGHHPAQRDSSAVHHQHQLAAFASVGQADLLAPLFAGTKVPSRKARDQSSLPWASRVAKRLCQTRRQVPLACHWSSRRQQVTELPYRGGKSRQRQPLRSTYRMPSRVRRSSALGRPVLLGGGRSDPISSHWASVVSSVMADSFLPGFDH